MLYKHLVKRFMDIFCALVLLVLFSPLFFLLILSLILFNKGQVFFIQERPGLNGKIFKIIKFKTMADAWDREGYLLPDEERITKLGSWIRNRSLDELPQLFNVLFGNMSMVGPRPLLVEYLAKYDQIQQRRHEVLPGITGWAQINGRNGISWEEKFRLDLWYVENQSTFLDAKIIFKSISRVLQGRGVRQEGQVSMLPFRGSGNIDQ